MSASLSTCEDQCQQAVPCLRVQVGMLRVGGFVFVQILEKAAGSGARV
jgi:hypothetical protein